MNSSFPVLFNQPIRFVPIYTIRAHYGTRWFYLLFNYTCVVSCVVNSILIDFSKAGLSQSGRTNNRIFYHESTKQHKTIFCKLTLCFNRLVILQYECKLFAECKL